MRSEYTVARFGSLDGETLRAMISTMHLNTDFGAFEIDSDGVPVAHR